MRKQDRATRHRLWRCVFASAAILMLPACAPGGAEPIQAVVTQSPGSLSAGVQDLHVTDAEALSELAEVLRVADTDAEDVHCYSTTFTTVAVTFSDGTAETFVASSCGATGRDEALGLVVARWVEDPP